MSRRAHDAEGIFDELARTARAMETATERAQCVEALRAAEEELRDEADKIRRLRISVERGDA